MNDLCNIDTIVFFSYIGFNIAAFAFLCNYLMFPKSLLTDLSNMIRKKPPRISYRTKNKLMHKNVLNIISFFYEVDIITYTILLYIICSILIVIILAAINMKVCTPCKIARLSIFIIAFIYCVVTTILLFCRCNEVIKKDYHWKKEGLLYMRLGLLLLIFFLVFIGILLWYNKGIKLFLFLSVFLMILFSLYLFPIGNRRPVTNILDLWRELAK